MTTEKLTVSSIKDAWKDIPTTEMSAPPPLSPQTYMCKKEKILLQSYYMPLFFLDTIYLDDRVPVRTNIFACTQGGSTVKSPIHEINPFRSMNISDKNLQNL